MAEPNDFDERDARDREQREKGREADEEAGFGESELDDDGDIADETPGHRN